MEFIIQEQVQILREVTRRDDRLIASILYKYIDREPHVAMQLALQDIFLWENRVVEDRFARDINTIRAIFPDVPVATIREMLRGVLHEPYGSKIVIKRLLAGKASPQGNLLRREDLPSTSGTSKSEPGLPLKKDQLDSWCTCMQKLRAGQEGGVGKPADSRSDDSDNTSDESEASSDDDVAEFKKVLLKYWKQKYPDASRKFLRNKCSNMSKKMVALKELKIDDGYPKRFSKTVEQLREVFPNVKVSALKETLKQFQNRPIEFAVFVSELLIKKASGEGPDEFPVEYKLMEHEEILEFEEDNELTVQEQEMIDLCTTKFDVIKFSKIFPDLATHFSVNHSKVWGDRKSYDYAITSLLNIYYNVDEEDIDRCIFGSKCFMEACEKLDKCNRSENKPRVSFSVPELVNNIPLLQEVAFKTHYTEIVDYLLERKVAELRLTEVRSAGLFATCNCCYNREVLPEDIYECEKGCKFCKLCIKKSVEVALGDGKLKFECLNTCPGHFGLETLNQVLSLELFKKIYFKIQMKELQESGIENLESCPFCDYTEIMETEGEVFECLNSDCMRKSCRLCKEPHHPPYLCDQVEKDENVKARTYVEEKMTLAVLRKCFHCGRKFVKSEGCNSVKCICGANLCYICEKYDCICTKTVDSVSMDEQKVTMAGQQAKEEVEGKLKIDPVANIQQYFADFRKNSAQRLHAEEAIAVDNLRLQHSYSNQGYSNLPNFRPQTSYMNVGPHGRHNTTVTVVHTGAGSSRPSLQSQVLGKFHRMLNPSGIEPQYFRPQCQYTISRDYRTVPVRRSTPYESWLNSLKYDAEKFLGAKDGTNNDEGKDGK